MKKLISLILACLIAFACATALGGCGRNAEDKQAFIASQSYYGRLVETLAAPVADIDADAIAEAAGEGMSGRVKLNVEGLSSFASLLGDVGDSFGFDVGVVSDGAAASGDLTLEMLGETLKALFSTDGGDLLISLPDLLARPAKLSRGDFAGTGFGDDFDFDAYEEEHGIIDLDEDAYEADYDFDENGKFFAENGDLYVDADGDGKLDIAYYAGKYDEDFVDSMIRNTREFYESLGDDLDVDDDSDFDDDFDVDDDFDYDYDYDLDDFGDDGFGSAPFGFDPNLVQLIARYAENFLANIGDGCYSSGREKFRTADGETELDCLTLKADGSELAEALQKTCAEIAEDPDLAEIYGENADAMREYFREAATEEFPKELKDVYKDYHVDWKRFSKDGAAVGERFDVKTPESEYSLEAGVDSGSSGTLAFLKLTDEKDGIDLVDAESTVGKKKAKLKLRVIANGVPYSFEVSGKTTEQDGVKTTDADVKVGFGGFMIKLFSMTTTVRAFSGEAVDFDTELSVSLPKLLVGSNVDLSLALSVQLKRDDAAQPWKLDADGAYTPEEMENGAFAEELENALKEKLPKMYEFFKSRQPAPVTDESDA